ncbi:uncharacterized protein LOC143352210 [Halictus rubicundus]|uniref:uncharacterized protein LOC143352210 n=1 Tax=Halictus rubicundus TaxID=77578 RepID=UPI004035088E
MFLEIEDETRDFITIYKKDFLGKGTEKRKEYRPGTAYSFPLNLLNGPYKKCLNTRRKNVSLSPEEQTEDPQECLNRIREKHLRLKNVFPETVPDEELIEQKENELMQTVYNCDYSKGDYSPRANIYGKWKDIALPKDWVISETIQRKSYRNPWKIASKILLQVKRFKKPLDNLLPSEKEREILRIKYLSSTKHISLITVNIGLELIIVSKNVLSFLRTGFTEYDATITNTGTKIMKEQLLGEPLPVEPKIYAKGPDSALSECSRILAEKKLVLPSNVI